LYLGEASPTEKTLKRKERGETNEKTLTL
jgi:hypothetical protein